MNQPFIGEWVRASNLAQCFRALDYHFGRSFFRYLPTYSDESQVDGAFRFSAGKYRQRVVVATTPSTILAR